MRSFLLLLTAACCWAGLVSSQCFSSIPECAQVCITNAATESTSCASTDWACQCTIDNQRTIRQSSQNCMFAACGQAMTYETVQPASDAFCLAINAGEACSMSSSSTSAGGTSTTFTSTTTTMTASMSTTSGPSGTGTSITSVTGTATAATSSSTAGAVGGAGSVGSFGMMVLGVLALI